MALYKVKLCAIHTADRDAMLLILGTVSIWPNHVYLGEVSLMEVSYLYHQVSSSSKYSIFDDPF